MAKSQQSQKEQVLTALKDTKGKGTLKEIFNKIDIKDWGTKTPINSVGSILCGLSKEGQVRLEGKIWVMKGVKIFQDLAVKNTIKSATGKNLYLITIHPGIKMEVEGLPFKVGATDKENVKTRLIEYNRSLPFETIRHITTYPLKIPKDISAKDVEKRVKGKLLKLPNIVKLYGGNQTEWFSATNYRSFDKLATDIRKIVNDEIANLKRG